MRSSAASTLCSEGRPPPKFVSKWAVEVAIRLRQLVCAQVSGGISRQVADDRYVRVISDLEDERAVLVDEMRRGER